ncbi:methylated-DNA--[protein]-cysteine S-methyltransferase [Actinokineospora guangxiensis]|uniref:Methylated-DNA--[protein]-cysteine S-methyltransferase n=1 Tax=Actinokineospora guangxiensis TaxID=1490288 RepID=A0ABW0EQ25_9PSEU
MTGHALFDTAIGQCGVAWGPSGITAAWLPGARRTGSPAKPPPAVAEAIRRITALLAGEKDDLRDIALDPAGVPEFHLRVYEVTRAIPVGDVLTYGEVARRVGQPGSAQAVGRALGRNPFPPIVPCHRVMGADGRMVGFSAPGGTTTKLRMLAIEGAADPYGQEALF